MQSVLSAHLFGAAAARNRVHGIPTGSGHMGNDSVNVTGAVTASVAYDLGTFCFTSVPETTAALGSGAAWT